MSKTANLTTLPTTMQAVLAYAPGDYRLETVDVPRAGRNDAGGGRPGCGF